MVSVRPESWRVLATTQNLADKFFMEHARFCKSLAFQQLTELLISIRQVADHLPQNDLGIPDVDRESGEALTVHGSQFNIPERIIGVPKNIDGFVSFPVL